MSLFVEIDLHQLQWRPCWIEDIWGDHKNCWDLFSVLCYAICIQCYLETHLPKASQKCQAVISLGFEYGRIFVDD